MDDRVIAERLFAALDGGLQLAPFSDVDPDFDVARAYRVLGDLHARRRAQGWRSVGRKIGFTNFTLWERYGVDRPMWSHVWNRTATFAPEGRASVALTGLHEPRIEPEVVFKLAAPLPPGDDPVTLLGAVEWVAAGFEIVHSVFPGWKFRAPDCTAALGLHGALVVGTPVAVTPGNCAGLAERLHVFALALHHGAKLVETGSGANVLGSPALALAHLRDLLAADTQFPPAAAGEIITTGTLTDAQPVAAGQTWTSDYGTLGVPGLSLTLR